MNIITPARDCIQDLKYSTDLVSGSVHFIDYEYAMFNCEHYEIGHHFCFMAGKLITLYKCE